MIESRLITSIEIERMSTGRPGRCKSIVAGLSRSSGVDRVYTRLTRGGGQLVDVVARDAYDSNIRSIPSLCLFINKTKLKRIIEFTPNLVKYWFAMCV